MNLALQWILVVTMHSPGGDVIGNTYPEHRFKTQADCMAVAKNIPRIETPMSVKLTATCVRSAGSV